MAGGPTKTTAMEILSPGDMVDQNILQSDWLRTFWPKPQYQNFPKNGICAETQQIK